MNTQNNVVFGLIVALVFIVGLVMGRGWNKDTNNASMHHGDMASMMHSMNMSLEGKTGDEFDKAFLEEMIIHHEGAVAMAQQVLEVSERPELITLAHDIIGTQEAEIAMMHQWHSDWFE